MTEKTLIDAAQNGNQESLRALLAPFEQPLFAYLNYNLKNPSDAADVAQETFLKAIHSLKSYKGTGSFKGWLFRIAHREMINLIRSRQKTASLAGSETMIPDKSSSRDSEMIKEESVLKLYEGIESLPFDEQQVVWMRLKSEMSFREIAEALEAPLNTILGRMHNAKKRLKTFLTPALMPE